MTNKANKETEEQVVEKTTEELEKALASSSSSPPPKEGKEKIIAPAVAAKPSSAKTIEDKPTTIAKTTAPKVAKEKNGEKILFEPTLPEEEDLEEEFKKAFEEGLSSETLIKEKELGEVMPTGGIQQRIDDLQGFKEKLEKKTKIKKNEAHKTLDQLKQLKEEFTGDIKEIKKLEAILKKIEEEIIKLKQMREEVLSLEEEARSELE